MVSGKNFGNIITTLSQIKGSTFFDYICDQFDNIIDNWLGMNDYDVIEEELLFLLKYLKFDHLVKLDEDSISILPRFNYLSENTKSIIINHFSEQKKTQINLLKKCLASGGLDHIPGIKKMSISEILDKYKFISN